MEKPKEGQKFRLLFVESGISFGEMALGSSSSVANSTNITNLGNMGIDIRVRANADMSCTLGNLGAGNVSYNTSSGSYSTMSSKQLSSSYVTEQGFDLGVEGVATGEGVNSTKNEYWTINIPMGVRGTCNNGWWWYMTASSKDPRLYGDAASADVLTIQNGTGSIGIGTTSSRG
jgi:hypothetical protein